MSPDFARQVPGLLNASESFGFTRRCHGRKRTRLQADVVEIYRDEDTARANGHVISELMDKNLKSAQALVHAPEMIYTDSRLLAVKVLAAGAHRRLTTARRC